MVKMKLLLRWFDAILILALIVLAGCEELFRHDTAGASLSLLWLVVLLLILQRWESRVPLAKQADEGFLPKAGVFLKEMLGRGSNTPNLAAKPTVGAVPRSPGSWRRQKATLEREHNSKQKERDLRVAGL